MNSNQGSLRSLQRRDLLGVRPRCYAGSSACAPVRPSGAGNSSLSLARRRSRRRTGSRSRCCRRSRPRPSRGASASVAGVDCSRTWTARRRDTLATRRTPHQRPRWRVRTPPLCSLSTNNQHHHHLQRTSYSTRCTIAVVRPSHRIAGTIVNPL